MIRKIAATAATFTLAAAALVGFTAPATAAAADHLEIQSVKVSAEPLKQQSKSTIVITVDFRATSSYSVSDPWITLESASGYDYEVFDLDPTSRGDLWRATLTADGGVTPGKWVVGVNASADFANGSSDFLTDDHASSFYLKRSTQLSLNASPEPVRKGSSVTVAGTLKGLMVNSNNALYYGAFKGQPVKLYFDPAGSAPKTYKGTVTTSSTGKYSKRFTAYQDGVWTATYAGSSKYAGLTSGGDFVDVK